MKKFESINNIQPQQNVWLVFINNKNSVEDILSAEVLGIEDFFEYTFYCLDIQELSFDKKYVHFQSYFYKEVDKDTNFVTNINPCGYSGQMFKTREEANEFAKLLEEENYKEKMEYIQQIINEQ